MKKFVVACDSFKGSMSAAEVCKIIKSALCEKYNDCIVDEIPVADGGEGTVEAYVTALGGELVYKTVKSPLGNNINGFWGRLADGCAVIECAAASGLTCDSEHDAMRASSYGTGQLISDALDSRAEKIIIGLGGSATTDGGAGMLMALGVRFLDSFGNSIPLGGIGLKSLESIDASNIDKRLASTEITVLCDVKNPLYGLNGAAYVYAPQKGANEAQVKALDEALRIYSKVCERQGFGSFYSAEGAGAAGGLGYALMSFTGAVIRRGIDTILDITDFDRKSDGAFAVITGEGKMDSQSLCGKVPFGVASRSKAKRNIGVVGVLEATLEQVHECGISEVYETNSGHLPFEKILPTCREDLYKTVFYKI